MLTEDRLKHTLSAAKRCQEIAREKGCDIRFQQEMFTVGYLHDIDYEFSNAEGPAGIEKNHNGTKIHCISVKN